MHPVKRGAMRRSCRDHAESILQILADFWNAEGGTGVVATADDAKPPQPLLVERDVAVCVFESARIVLFCCASGSQVDNALVEDALTKARLSVSI